VREKTTLSERKKYPPREKEQPKNLVSSPIGVTSHTTPLPTGEGTGEGPAGEGRGAGWGRKRGHLVKEEEPALFGIKRPLQGFKQRSKKKA